MSDTILRALEMARDFHQHDSKMYATLTEAIEEASTPAPDEFFDMLWKWFSDESRHGKAEMRSNHEGLSAADFEEMLDEHEAALQGPRPVVSMKPMALSDGRTDYFVSIKVGDREVTPHVFREAYKSLYHVALYDWLLNGKGEEPDVVEFGPSDWPAKVSPESDRSDDIVTWLRQPRWVEGPAQKRLFDAADEIELLRACRKVERSSRPREFSAWALETFGPVAKLRGERLMRFIEEAVELAHADNMELETLHAIIRRVFSRPAGSIEKEIGQAQVCLEMYAENYGASSDDLAQKEWLRVRQIPREEWERRHSAKQKIGIALQDPVPSMEGK